MKPLIGVVVPVHQEEESLEACLRALDAARHASRRALDVAVTVVLDACHDGSARIAGGFDVSVTVVDARRVGLARRAGCRAALDAARRPVWLASTDADSTVPADWLAMHHDAWRGGADAIVGTVHRAGRRPATPAPGEHAHPHVYGANLGVRPWPYLAVGGFAPWSCHEDSALVAALERARFRVHRTRRASVATSARTTGRVQGGFATYLAAHQATEPGGEHPARAVS